MERDKQLISPQSQPVGTHHLTFKVRVTVGCVACLNPARCGGFGGLCVPPLLFRFAPGTGFRNPLFQFGGGHGAFLDRAIGAVFPRLPVLPPDGSWRIGMGDISAILPARLGNRPATVQKAVHLHLLNGKPGLPELIPKNLVEIVYWHIKTLISCTRST